MKEITVQQLKSMIDAGEDFQLVDVREPHEYELTNIEGELIPLGEVAARADEVETDKKVVVMCRSGKRSATAIEYLEDTTGHEELYNLVGGILAWGREIDDKIVQY
ncbi:rhodanese-like domain-containing protein [Persicobacter psychrovividus]|uniref:Rhodanese domain-containing protein n=1 Tax=Persicobacter psychrovividus TaxID=387638 RepID=A0ABM7VER7_9BACT|nr:hypothetical protein PEPS_17220 [Persicobacter psychrovividus]